MRRSITLGFSLATAALVASFAPTAKSDNWEFKAYVPGQPQTCTNDCGTWAPAISCTGAACGAGGNVCVTYDPHGNPTSTTHCISYFAYFGGGPGIP